MRPRVILFDAVSVDGRIEGFSADIGRFYELARKVPEDVTLAGADTMLAGGDEIPLDDVTAPPPQIPSRSAPLIAIVDSRGRFRSWDWLREQPYWRDAVALVSEATPAAYLEHLDSRGVRWFRAGGDHVDLPTALDWLAEEHGAAVVRVESGGALNSALLAAGLAAELWLLVHPVIASAENRSFVRGAGVSGVRLDLSECEPLDGGLVFARYLVRNDAP